VVCGEDGESVCGVWLVFGVLLPLEVVAEQVENSREVLSVWVHFRSLLDCLHTLLIFGSVCVLLARRLGRRTVAFLRKTNMIPTLLIQLYYYHFTLFAAISTTFASS
jgi:hypothetical protein